jgi:hypothetical protein
LRRSTVRHIQSQEQQASSLWGADWAADAEDNVEVSAPSWNNVLAPGATVSIGFVVGGDGADSLPDSFSFRGADCAPDGEACPEL